MKAFVKNETSPKQRLVKKFDTSKENRSSKTWNLDFFSKIPKEISSIHKVYQSEQVILFDALSRWSDIDITFMSILPHRISYLTHYNSQKTKTILILQKKRSAEFQPSQWNSTKKNQNSKLFVCSQKFLRTHKPKKREVPKTRFKTISCSLLASKLQFGEHPQLRIWAGQNYPHALRNNVSKRRFKKPLKLLICFNTSCVKLLRLRLTSKQPKPSSVFSYI